MTDLERRFDEGPLNEVELVKLVRLLQRDRNLWRALTGFWRESAESLKAELADFRHELERSTKVVCGKCLENPCECQTNEAMRKAGIPCHE